MSAREQPPCPQLYFCTPTNWHSQPHLTGCQAFHVNQIAANAPRSLKMHLCLLSGQILKLQPCVQDPRNPPMYTCTKVSEEWLKLKMEKRRFYWMRGFQETSRKRKTIWLLWRKNYNNCGYCNIEEDMSLFLLIISIRGGVYNLHELYTLDFHVPSFQHREVWVNALKKKSETGERRVQAAGGGGSRGNGSCWILSPLALPTFCFLWLVPVKSLV